MVRWLPVGFAIPTTWAGKPASPPAGTRARFADLGNREYVHTGSIWLPADGAPFAQSGEAQAVTGTTNETTLATITIPGGMLGPNGVIRVLPAFSYPTSGNSKTCRVRLGGEILFQFAPAANVSFQALVLVRNKNAANAQYAYSVLGTGGDGLGTSSNAAHTATVDTTQDQDLTITMQMQSAAETGVLEGYTVEVQPGA